MIEYRDISGVKIAYVTDHTINCLDDALDLIGEVFGNGCSRIIIGKEMFSDDFFALKTGLAGEILQKFSNYNMKLAIIGDFDNIESNSLKAFIYECNRGKLVFFKKTYGEAEAALI